MHQNLLSSRHRARLRAIRDLASEGIRIGVSGRCMEPYIKDGTKVSVGAREMYWPGDILFFRNSNGKLVLHRLLGYYRRQGCWRLLTQADSAKSPDNSIGGEDVIGAALDTPVTMGQRAGALVNYLRHAFRRSLPGIRP